MFGLTDMQNHPRFAEIRETVEKAGSDCQSLFGGTHDGGYATQQNPDEFAALVCLLLNRCRPIDVYGEIGSAAGGTLRLIQELVDFAVAVVLDDGNHPKHSLWESNTGEFRNRVVIHRGDSHAEAAKEFVARTCAFQKFDVIFIDGDHSYEGVKKDIELVLPFCTPATLLVFHDTVCCPGVTQAFAELPNKVAEFIGPTGLGIGVARVGA